MYWRKSIEDLCEKCSTSQVFRIQSNKNCSENASFKKVLAIGGRAAMMMLHALWVFLRSPLFDCKMRTLFVMRPLLGNRIVTQHVLLSCVKSYIWAFCISFQNPNRTILKSAFWVARFEDTFWKQIGEC